MSWRGHKATYRCADHPKLTVRARRYRALESTMPRCRTCGKPMELADPVDRYYDARALHPVDSRAQGGEK